MVWTVDSSSGAPRRGGEMRVVAAVLARPWLWLTALRQLRLLAPRRWWAAAPRSPVPAAPYLRFRAITAYGDPDRLPEPADVVSWLTWCRAWGRSTKVQTESGRQG
jgi:hypothetical protein